MDFVLGVVDEVASVLPLGEVGPTEVVVGVLDILLVVVVNRAEVNVEAGGLGLVAGLFVVELLELE